MKKLFFGAIVFVGCFVVLFLRFSGLSSQGFLFYDEASFYYRATQYILAIESALNVPLPSFYPDTKLLWMGLLTIIRSLFLNIHVAGNILSAVFGLIGILLTFILTQRLFHSRLISGLSAGILAILPLHIFYSRVGLPETLSLDCLLLSLICATGSLSGKKSLTGAAAWTAAAFLANRFRVSALFLYYLLLPLGFSGGSLKDQIRQRLKSWILYVALSFFFIFIGIKFFEIAYLLKGIIIAPYAQSMQKHLSLHAVAFPSIEDIILCFILYIPRMARGLCFYF